MSELEKLRADEARLEKTIRHNVDLLRLQLPCCDIAALAEQLSETKKAIGTLTMGKLFTA